MARQPDILDRLGATLVRLAPYLVLAVLFLAVVGICTAQDMFRVVRGGWRQVESAPASPYWIDANSYSVLIRSETNGSGLLIDSGVYNVSITNFGGTILRTLTNSVGDQNPVWSGDTIDDYIKSGIVPLSDTNITLSTWVKFVEPPEAGDYNIIIGNNTSAAWNNGAILWAYGSAGNIGIRFAPRNYAVPIQSAGLDTNIWYFITATAMRTGDLSKAYCTLWIDGSLTASNSLASSASYNTANAWYYGSGVGSYYSSKLLDYIGISSNIWTQNTITNVMRYSHPTNCLVSPAGG
jgi:hypothetical protein